MEETLFSASCRALWSSKCSLQICNMASLSAWRSRCLAWREAVHPGLRSLQASTAHLSTKLLPMALYLCNGQEILPMSTCAEIFSNTMFERSHLAALWIKSRLSLCARSCGRQPICKLCMIPMAYALSEKTRQQVTDSATVMSAMSSARPMVCSPTALPAATNWSELGNWPSIRCLSAAVDQCELSSAKSIITANPVYLDVGCEGHAQLLSVKKKSGATTQHPLSNTNSFRTNGCPGFLVVNTHVSVSVRMPQHHGKPQQVMLFLFNFIKHSLKWYSDTVKSRTLCNTVNPIVFTCAKLASQGGFWNPLCLLGCNLVCTWYFTNQCFTARVRKLLKHRHSVYSRRASKWLKVPTLCVKHKEIFLPGVGQQPKDLLKAIMH